MCALLVWGGARERGHPDSCVRSAVARLLGGGRGAFLTSSHILAKVRSVGKKVEAASSPFAGQLLFVAASRSCWEPTTPDLQVRRPFAQAKRTAGESSPWSGSGSALAASTPRDDTHRRRSRLPGRGWTRVTVSRQGSAPAGRLQMKTFAFGVQSQSQPEGSTCMPEGSSARCGKRQSGTLLNPLPAGHRGPRARLFLGTAACRARPGSSPGVLMGGDPPPAQGEQRRSKISLC